MLRLRSPRLAFILAGVATAAAWALTIHRCSDMSNGMSMPGDWSMSMAWMPTGNHSGAERAALFLGMWTVMMVAMMLPSVMPAVALHRRLLDMRASRGELGHGSNFLLLFGYFAVWTAFGGAVYMLGAAIVTVAMHSVRFSRAIPAATGLALATAGIYQLTSWKQVCLSHCRSPLEFFSRRHIRSRVDSMIFGLHHGWYCAACCWALMLIQLVLGVMNLPLMAAVAGVICLEKLWRHGPRLAVAVGIVSVTGGALMVLRAVTHMMYN
jgi:predicted metal-binding membrane protein